MSQSFCNRQDYSPWVVLVLFWGGLVGLFTLPGKPLQNAPRKATLSQTQRKVASSLCPLLVAKDITGYNKLHSHNASFNLH